jgi:hypothetical protein
MRVTRPDDPLGRLAGICATKDTNDMKSDGPTVGRPGPNSRVPFRIFRVHSTRPSRSPDPLSGVSRSRIPPVLVRGTSTRPFIWAGFSPTFCRFFRVLAGFWTHVPEAVWRDRDHATVGGHPVCAVPGWVDVSSSARSPNPHDASTNSMPQDFNPLNAPIRFFAAQAIQTPNRQCFLTSYKSLGG